MADIKLYYFNLRARGEAIRMVLTAAGQKFEDNKISFDDWKSKPEIKAATPYGQLPYVIMKGKTYGQSIPLASYFAKKYGYFGKTDEDALRMDEVMNIVEDLRVPHIRDWFFAPDEAKKAEKVKELKSTLFPRYFDIFKAFLKENGDKGYFVGSSVTLADMFVFDFLETCLGIDPECLAKYPELKKLSDNVKSFPKLKAYLASRPKVPI